MFINVIVYRGEGTSMRSDFRFEKFINEKDAASYLANLASLNQREDVFDEIIVTINGIDFDFNFNNKVEKSALYGYYSHERDDGKTIYFSDCDETPEDYIKKCVEAKDNINKLFLSELKNLAKIKKEKAKKERERRRTEKAKKARIKASEDAKKLEDLKKTLGV